MKFVDYPYHQWFNLLRTRKAASLRNDSPRGLYWRLRFPELDNIDWDFAGRQMWWAIERLLGKVVYLSYVYYPDGRVFHGNMLIEKVVQSPNQGEALLIITGTATREGGEGVNKEVTLRVTPESFIFIMVDNTKPRKTA